MSMAARMKSTGSIVLGLAIMIGMSAVGIGLLMGAAAFSLWVLKWTFPAFAIILLVSIAVLAPLALIPATRGFSAIGFVIASHALGAILWLWGMGYTYTVWGMFGVIVGLVFFGVGVVPVAMVAALVHGDWGNLGMFIATGIAIIAFRALASWLAGKADERNARLHEAQLSYRAYRNEGNEI